MPALHVDPAAWRRASTHCQEHHGVLATWVRYVLWDSSVTSSNSGIKSLDYAVCGALQQSNRWCTAGDDSVQQLQHVIIAAYGATSRNGSLSRNEWMSSSAGVRRPATRRVEQLLWMKQWRLPCTVTVASERNQHCGGEARTGCPRGSDAFALSQFNVLETVQRHCYFKRDIIDSFELVAVSRQYAWTKRQQHLTKTIIWVIISAGILKNVAANWVLNFTVLANVLLRYVITRFIARSFGPPCILY